MVESRKQVEVAKEQSAKLAVANLEQEVGTLRMERDKYKGFWLEVKVKAETDQAKLNNKKQTVKLVNFDQNSVPPILDRDKYKKLLQSLKKEKVKVKLVKSPHSKDL